MVADVLREFAAPVSLRPLVRSLWMHRTASTIVHREVPDGGMHLVLQAGSEPRWVDHRRAPMTTQLPAGTLLVGARLRPGAIRAVDDPAIERWRRQLAADVNGVALAGELGRVLTDHLARWPGHGDAVVSASVRALARDPTRPFDELVRASGLSSRQWRRRLVAQVGIGPKRLQRLYRFQRVLHLVDRRQGGALALLAADAGYADQAHFTRECRELSGRSPAALVRDTVTACGTSHHHVATVRPIRSRPADHRAER